MPLKKDDMITHWAIGPGRVVEVPTAMMDVPWCWRHDWQAVVLCEFEDDSIAMEPGVPFLEWVVAEDCDVDDTEASLRRHMFRIKSP
tara:strand:+ start:213 stop:473 length:261 start_codon:yes stop_codon:yes gene_type:complete